MFGNRGWPMVRGPTYNGAGAPHHRKGNSSAQHLGAKHCDQQEQSVAASGMCTAMR